ncbi:DUF4393 domain-containing protein [Senimuribacter intestinalis]|uniref:DUF4393 domain-containing protein n=1 Tax=Senimuribacter intestinalis TaxID=2941507 RepID=UPI00203FB113|nr:DUF4393 domain-containing protein [Senimuribacter intestinalis]
MSEDKVSIFPDVVTSVSEAAQKNIPETVRQTDGTLSTVVGFFNNVVLYPVKKANITFRYKLEAFEDDLKEKIKDIPEENLQVPPTRVAGPTLEALRYAYDEEELREMFENLLASSMDNRTDIEVHPAFVEAIKQMSTLDAKVLSKILDLRQMKCVDIKFAITNSTKVYSKGMPNYFVAELCDLSDPFLISSSLDNLDRLALIKITEGGIQGADYESIKEHPYVKSRETLFKSFGEKFDIKVGRHAVIITNHGEQFARTCLNKNI